MDSFELEKLRFRGNVKFECTNVNLTKVGQPISVTMDVVIVFDRVTAICRSKGSLRPEVKVMIVRMKTTEEALCPKLN